MKKFFIGILVLVSFFTVLNASDNHIKLEMPDAAENTDFIPIKVIIDNGLKKGDLLIVKANNQTAFLLQTNGNEIIRIKAKLRGLKYSSVKISAVLIRKNGKFEFTSKKVILPEYSRTFLELGAHGRGSTKVKVLAKKNRIKLLLKNRMAKTNYAKNLVLSTSAGTIKIKMTPILSKNPYFKIIGKKNFGQVSAKATISNVKYNLTTEVNKKRFISHMSNDELSKIIENDPYNIQYIKNPTFQMQMLALYKSISKYSNKSDKKRAMCNIIQYINNPTDQIKKTGSNGCNQ